MNINWIGALFFGYLSIGVVSADVDNCTSFTGYTWDCEDCSSIKGVSNWTACAEKCLAEPWCIGYTWELNDVAGSECFLFKELKNQHPCDDCSNCTSGTFKKINGSCSANGDDIVDTKHATTELECLHHCAEEEECDFYSWSNSTLMKNVCFLLKNCVVAKSCESFLSGSPACRADWNLPDECTNYKILDHSTRNVNYGYYSACDINSSSYRRDWAGSNWYRMIEPAGIRMPESSPGYRECGTTMPGWLNGTHPDTTGSSISAEVCFVTSSSTPCGSKINTKITNCGRYFVYHLQDVYSCNRRYCAE